MVLGRPARRVPSLVVPDELALTVWGHDPYARGLAPVSACGAARALLIAEPLPEPLRAARVELDAALPNGASTQTVTLSGPAALASERATDAASPNRHMVGGEHHLGDDRDASDARGHESYIAHDRDEGQAEIEHVASDHGSHDRNQMMAITGEPSADGLVMEPTALSYGPLLTPLPGGVVCELELDGDVVSLCTVRATLQVAQPSGGTLVPDPLAPAAWMAVLGAVLEARAGIVSTVATQWLRVATVELERAVSHLAWLRCFARLLGWAPLARRAQPALDALADARTSGIEPLAIAAAAADEVIALMRRHRVWSTRTRGRGLLEDHSPAYLYGPNARAAGVARDVRTSDHLYLELGFEPVLEDDADARARTLVRAREAAQSARLAADALRRGASSTGRSERITRGSGTVAVVEGPRGPLTACATDGGLLLAAPGERAAVSAAPQAAIGREWAAALVGVASLDLSPWRVGA